MSCVHSELQPEHKSSLQHQSAFPGDNVDDGGEKTDLKEKSREDDGEGHLDYHMGLVMKDRCKPTVVFIVLSVLVLLDF